VTRRAAALLLAGPPAARACPPGIAPAEFARALAEDVADLLADLPGLEPVVAAAPDRVADAEDVVWPGTPVLEVPGRPVDVLAALAKQGYDEAAVFVADAPDLPGLLVAKPFSALSTAPVAAAPNRGDVVLTPPWRRLRRREDLASLDPELEGWEATRALLAG